MNLIKSHSLLKLLCLLLFFSMSNALAQVKNPTPQTSASLSPEDLATARELLSSLGYWLNFEASAYDASIRHALIAFQKVEGRKVTGKLTPDELNALRTAKKPTPMEAGDPHIEVDLQRQVLFIIDNSGMISLILPISSGSGKLYTQDGATHRAVTPLGRFKVERKISGWRKSPLGLLYFPNYFHRGFAIHGNPAVPIFPASHGCVRIPMFASKEFSTIATVGMVVLVHDGTSLPLTEKLPDTEIFF